MGLGGIADRWTAAAARRAVARRLVALEATPNATLRDELEEWCAEHGDRPALRSGDGGERASYADLAARARRWARWTILAGLGRGDRLVLVMANRPERVAAWLGVAEVGAVAVPVDAGRDDVALAAAIDAAAAAHIVVDAPLLPRFEAAAPHLGRAAAVAVHGPHPMAYLRIDEALADLSGERLRPADRRPVAPGDDALWVIGADGTPIRTDHRRAIRRMHAAAAAAGARREDRLFLPEVDLDDPAGVLAAGVVLGVGGLAVLEAGGAAPVSDAAMRATIVARSARRALVGPENPRVELILGDPAGIGAAAGAAKRLVWRGGEIGAASGRTIWREAEA